MTLFSAFILGLVQGLTEFLPVSSSGHLAIFQRILNVPDGGAAFAIFLHLATLVSVIFVYYKDVVELIREFFGMIADLFRGRFNIRSPYRRMLILLIIATIPATILGLLLSEWFDGLMANLIIVGCMLFVTCILMLVIDRLPQGGKDAKNASFWDGLFVGLVQAAALMPGLSRSGSTITASRMRGFTKEFAIKFSFLMSIPAIIGAVLLESIKVMHDGGFNFDVLQLLIGFITAAVVGVLAIKFLISLLNKQKFYVFGIYCAVAGVAAFVLHFI